MSHHINKVRIKAIANSLDDLKDKVVFVGGATLAFYPTKPVFAVRATDDVDVIIELLNYNSRTELEQKLRSIGFTHDVESGVICRYQIQGIVVDIMPTTDASIGFSNKWYPDGYNNAIKIAIDDQCTVKILSAPYFIATKLEAFKTRGNGYGRTSHDFEDIIYILENRKEIWQELKEVNGRVGDYLRSEFQDLLNNPNIKDWIDGHVERNNIPATEFILGEIRKYIQYI